MKEKINKLVKKLIRIKMREAKVIKKAKQRYREGKGKKKNKK